MVKIRKGDLTLIIPNGAYEKQYKPQGWKVDGEESEQEIATEVEEEVDEEIVPEIETPAEEDEQEEEWDEATDAVESELEEKPLSEMNREELTEFARIKGVNIEGLAKNAQIREAIKNALSK